MVEYVYPKPLNMPKQFIETIAKDISDIFKFKAGDDLQLIIQRLGGKVVLGSTGDEDKESGSLLAKSLDNFTIYLSPFTSLTRDRFTIAHELGHLFLHLPKIQEKTPDAVMRATRFVNNEDTSQQRAEWEANWFAASLLMPETEFKKISNEGMEKVKLYFKVSEHAARVRAQSLNLNIA